jgi:hypothetical protein
MMSQAPILRLPVELHLDIVDRLDLHEKVELACTNRYFMSIIPPPSHNELLVAEKDPWPTAKELLTCKGCLRFCRLQDFADEMRKGRRCRGRSEAATRFCLKCGVEDALYAPGTHLTICNRPHVLCSICRDLTNHVSDNLGVCAGCCPGSRHSWMRFRHQNNDYIDNDAGWLDTTHRSSDRHHLRDHYIQPEW